MGIYDDLVVCLILGDDNLSIFRGHFKGDKKGFI